MFFRGNAVKKTASIWFLAAASLTVCGATTPMRAEARALANAKTSARPVTRPAATAVPAQLIAASSSAISASENVETAASVTVVSSSSAKPNALEVAAQRLSKPAASPRASVKTTPRAATKLAAKQMKSSPKVAVRPVLVSSVSSETVESYIMMSRPANAAKSRPDAKPVSVTSRDAKATANISTSSTRAVTSTSTSPITVKGTSSTRTAVKVAPTRVALLPPTQSEAKAVEPTLNRAIAPRTPAVAESKSLGALVTAGRNLPTKTPAAKTSIVKVPVVRAPQRKPANLNSRARDRMLLVQMENDLRRAQGRLNNANETLSRGQNQLMKVSGTLQQAMLEAGSDAKGLHPFVRVAQRYAGTPYVWGGESRNGFDCSGFIIVVMRDLGYRALPHSAAEQFNYGTPIAKPLIKPGDIVFFKNTYKRGVSHVGIAIGRNRFIHAAGTGQGTIVSSLSEPKWVEKYAGARRLVRNR